MTPSVERDGKLGVTLYHCDGVTIKEVRWYNFSTILLPYVHPVSTE